MDEKLLGRLIGEIDYLMERPKLQSQITEKEMELSAQRVDVYRQGGGYLLLLCELFGGKAEEVPEYEGLREIVQTVDSVVSTLPAQAQALVAERFGLSVETALSNVGTNGNRRLQLNNVLKMLKQPRWSRRLRPLLGPKGRRR